jgi:hypothetical protein
MIEPAQCPRACQREGDDEEEAGGTGQRQQNLPAKKLEAAATVAGPPFADVALLGNHAVKQNEAHYAADVKKQEKQCNSRENQKEN